MAQNPEEMSNTVFGRDEESTRVRKASTTVDQEAVRAEKGVELKKRRAGFKAVLTKRRNELLNLMDRGENVGCVELKILDLNEAFEKFVDAHKLYCSYVNGSESSVELGEYYQQEVVLFNGVKERANGWLAAMACAAVEPIVRPEDSVSLIGTRSRASSGRLSTSSGSSSRLRLIEEEARRKALEARMNLLGLEQQIAERKFHLEQEEELLKLKTDLAQTVAREQVYAKADAVENGARLVTEDRGPVCPSSANHHQVNDDFAVRKEVPLWYPPEESKLIQINPASEEHLPRVPLSYSPQRKETTPTNAASEEHLPRPLRYSPEERKPLTDNITSDRHLTTLVSIQEMQMKCMQNLAARQHQSAMALTLPKPEVPVFSGDPIDYCDFVRAFECLIEARTDSSSSRLYYLVQYTRGEVQELMRSCLPMKPDEGYKEARKLLKRKYGQNYKIAAACVDRVTKGNAIRPEDTKALQSLSVMLISCRNTLNEIGHRSKIENPDSLKGIVERLPYDLRKRWRVTADYVSEVQEREICFDDIVDFVEKEARVAAHPLFGNLTAKPQEQDKDKKVHKFTPSNRHNFATNVREEEHAVSELPDAAVPVSRDRNCAMCNRRGHRLEECEEFKSLGYTDRLKFVRDKSLCYNCLIPFHRASQCRRKDACGDCDQKHSPLLHPFNDANRHNRDSSEESGPASRASNGLIGLEGSVCGHTETTRSSIGLPIVPVRVKARGSRDSVVTFAFLDSGSNSTFCTEELLEQLGLEGKKTSLSLTTLGKENNCVESSVVSLEVYDLGEHEFLELPVVFSTPKLPVSVDDIPRQKDIEKWPHLSGISVPQVTAQVGILIGNDNARALEPQEVRQSQRKGPYAVKTIFGWTVNGPLGREQGEASYKANFIRGDILLDQQFQKFMELEFSDSLADTTTQMSQEDRKAITIMEETTQLNNGHYEIALPWKSYPPSLPSNRPLAEHRLKHLKRRFLKDPGLHGRYSAVLEDYVHKGYAEKVPDHALNRSDGFVWYLPHHPVFHPEKPDKTRVVFDCAAKYRNVSLNDCLLQGPDLNSTLVGVLTRFRQEPIALMSDIESMFNQVRVTPSHCDALRFLWWPGGDLNRVPQEFRMKVHLFGGVSSPSCSIYALQKTAEDNKDEFAPATIETVKKNFYVDDCLKSVKDENEAMTQSKELRELLSKGGFRLTKWLSNSSKVTASIPESERAKSVKDLDLESMPVERALGVNWDMEADRFGFVIKIKDRPPTRRGILSVVSSVYDPLGFVGPFILPAKALLQDLCRRGLGWDDAIPEESLGRWQQWLHELPKLTEYAVDRCVKPRSLDEVVSSQLHHFSDASETGYGAVTYLRLTDRKGQIHCALMMAKSRLVPLKAVSIPRLELSAATVAVKLDKLMRKELQLPIDTSHFWTDSTTVLRYIRNEDKRFHTFVANRIAVVRDGSEPSQWRHVETKLNPADDASRGLTVDAFLAATRWVNGPPFLWKSEADWPCPFSDELGVSDCDPEVKREARTYTTAVDDATTETDRILERFSSWQNLKKFIA